MAQGHGRVTLPECCPATRGCIPRSLIGDQRYEPALSHCRSLLLTAQFLLKNPRCYASTSLCASLIDELGINKRVDERRIGHTTGRPAAFPFRADSLSRRVSVSAHVVGSVSQILQNAHGFASLWLLILSKCVIHRHYVMSQFCTHAPVPRLP